MWHDFEHHADILVIDASCFAAQLEIVRVVRHRHFLPDEQLAGFVVADVELRIGQHVALSVRCKNWTRKSMLMEPETRRSGAKSTPARSCRQTRMLAY